MTGNLRAAAFAVIGLAVFVPLLFWPAGTFDYWQGWAFIAVFVVLTIPYTVYLAVKHPAVLEKRVRIGPTVESRMTQRIAVFGLQASVLAAMLVSALDHRFGWSNVPTWVCVLGLALTAVGLAIATLVVLQNSWAAATVEIQAGQELVATGLYGLVRHPMYTGAVIMLIGIPLGLGSYWGLIPVLVGFLTLVIRLLDEEQMLEQDLPGYREYRAKVRSRLVPYIW